MLLGRLTGIWCNEVTQVSVNDTVVVLICTVASCGIRVNADFADPGRMRAIAVNDPSESGSDHRHGGGFGAALFDCHKNGIIRERMIR